jgi:cytochrome c oxidase cbb3-type subunit 1
MYPYYVMRTVGGFIYFLGAVVMLYNMVMTIRQASSVPSMNTATAQA